MLLPSRMSWNALLMSASGIVWVMIGSISIFLRIYQSTIFGTSERPRAPPKAVPRHTRPVTSWNGRGGGGGPAGGVTAPHPAGDELERPGGDLLPRACDADDDALAPATMAAL